MGKIPATMPPNGGYMHQVDDTNTTWDNVDGVVLVASATLTTNTNSTTQKNTHYRGIRVYIVPGAFGSGASTIKCTLQGHDPTSDTWYTVLQSAALSDSTFVQLHVYPGLAVAANATANDVLPLQWRVALTASDWGTGGSIVGVSCALEL